MPEQTMLTSRIPKNYFQEVSCLSMNKVKYSYGHDIRILNHLIWALKETIKTIQSNALFHSLQLTGVVLCLQRRVLSTLPLIFKFQWEAASEGTFSIPIWTSYM